MPSTLLARDVEGAAALAKTVVAAERSPRCPWRTVVLNDENHGQLPQLAMLKLS